MSGFEVLKRVEKEGFERVLNEGRVRLFRRLVEAWQIGADGAVFLERARNLINRSKQQGEPPAGVVENKGPIKVNSLTGREGGRGVIKADNEKVEGATAIIMIRNNMRRVFDDSAFRTSVLRIRPIGY